MSANRRTWAKWRERNATGRDAYYDRMERADQCLATCPVCWTQCDMPEGHLYAHQFAGKCEPASFDEAIRYARGGYLDRAPEIVGNGDCLIEFMPDQSTFVDGLRRVDEPVPLWEPVTHTWADFKAAIERATHG